MEMVSHGEESESSELYENFCHASAKDAVPQSRSGADSKVPVAENVKKSACRDAAVFLGVACLLLLIGLITSVSQLTRNKSDGEKAVVMLQTSYNTLTEEKTQLQTNYTNLVYERHQLENNLTREKNQLQTSYDQLATENARLQERYEGLNNDRNNLHRKFQDIEASYKNLTEQSDNLKRILNQFEWMHIGGSSYYISSVEKTWPNSRQDCRQKGADLIVINSKEEQIFTNQFKRPVWIGLTDSQTEGRWQWVDGTPVTKRYWSSGEPNGGNNENCVETKSFNAENSWNDAECSASRTWICEKKMPL